MTTTERAARIERIRNLTNEQLATMYRCTVDQIREQSRANAAQLRQMAAKADRTGKKVNGYTADQLRTNAAAMDQRAAQ